MEDILHNEEPLTGTPEYTAPEISLPVYSHPDIISDSGDFVPFPTLEDDLEGEPEQESEEGESPEEETPAPVKDDLLPEEYDDDIDKSEAEEEAFIDSMVEENRKRLDLLNLVGIDQRTGEGVPSHTVKCEIPDYPLPVQWLTEEVSGNPLYRKVMLLGSVANYVSWFNAVNAEKLGGGALTAEQVCKRLMAVRLSRDPSFAFAICFFIQDKKSGKTIPFTLNYPQLILLEELEKMRRAGIPIRLVLLKARQWGGSTLVQLYMAWIQMFLKQGWNSVIVAQTKDTAKRIKAMYSRTLANFGASDIIFKTPHLQFSPKEKSNSDFIVTDGSGRTVRDNTITVASFENFEATRGANFAMAHYSEVAYWINTPGKTSEGLITNIAGGMLYAPLTLEVLESTANGMSGFFYDEYQMAKAGKSNRAHLFIPFYYIKIDSLPFRSDKERRDFAARLFYDRKSLIDTSTTQSGSYLFSLWQKGASLESIHWYVKKRASFHDHASMASEAPSDDVECFKHSGHTIFDQYLIEKYRKMYVKDPVWTGDIVFSGGVAKLGNRDEKGLLGIWVHPEPSYTEDRYMAVVDVGGRSSRSDFSVITVVDRWPLRFGGKVEVVARWRGHIRYDQLAVKAVHIARFYCNALLVFESNTFDKKKAESTEFVERGDHTRGILSTIEDTYENLYLRNSTSPEDLRIGRFKKVGFQTNVKTKQDMVDLFTVGFEEDNLMIDPDERVYQEMSIYEQREDGSYGNIAGRGNHDDILMTDMIACLISRDMPVPSSSEKVVMTGWDNGTQNESFL